VCVCRPWGGGPGGHGIQCYPDVTCNVTRDQVVMRNVTRDSVCVIRHPVDIGR